MIFCILKETHDTLIPLLKEIHGVVVGTSTFSERCTDDHTGSIRECEGSTGKQ